MIAQDRRFIGVSGLSATAAAAIMSALQQSPIYGLEELEIPLSRRGPPGISRRETRPAKPVARHTVAARRGGSREVGVFARAVVAAAVMTRSATGEQDGV